MSDVAVKYGAADNVKAVMAFAPHVGVFILAFSTIDVELAKIISFVHPRCAAEGINLKMPRDLSKKIGQVRRAFGEVEALSPWKDAMLALIDDIHSMTPTRHLFAHGAVALNALHFDELFFEKVNPDDASSITQIHEVLSISKSTMRTEAQKALTVVAGIYTVIADTMRADEESA